MDTNPLAPHGAETETAIMRTSDQILTALSRATVSGNSVKLPAGLDDNLRAEVAKALTAGGGRWQRRTEVYLFDGDAAVAVAAIISRMRFAR
jgi:hypothetical protein